ncbi:hypothetical protein [Gallibacterium anatis]|uniref:hypothetical protein n=1 Tax=Gallibacterium anatis TaxID=750 RepID=UPI000531BC8A|nr:hypothetical protein [Gallibacterium anatis]KGQ66098.1 hypothetical protein IO49_06305 [Gallibacterium anatis]
MSENFGYKLGKFIKNNFSASTQKVVSAGVDSLEKRLNKPVKPKSKRYTNSSDNDEVTTVSGEFAKSLEIDASLTYYEKIK